MIRAQRGQFRIDLQGELTIERLPVGLANGAWRLSFVVTGARSLWEKIDHANGASLTEVLSRHIAVEGLGGPWKLQGAGSNGDAREMEYRVRVVGEELIRLKVVYLHDGESMGEEVIDLGGRGPAA